MFKHFIVIVMLGLSLIACNAQPPAPAVTTPASLAAQAQPVMTNSIVITDTAIVTNAAIITTTSAVTETVVEAEESFFGPMEVSPARLENITVVITDTVSVVARGTFANGCVHIGEITQQPMPQNAGISVTIQANRMTEAMCTQALVPFEVVVPLEVAGWAAGTYQLTVNNLNTTFDLTTTPTASQPISPMTATEILTDWRRVTLPEVGLSLEIPADWVTLDETTWSPNITSTQRLGIHWARTGSSWQPTSMLPVEAQIGGRLTVELGWSSGLLYQVQTMTMTELHLIAPLDGPVAYDFYLSVTSPETLSAEQAKLEYMAKSAQLSSPKMAACMPDATTQLFVSDDNSFCLLYPLGFNIAQSNPLVIMGANGGQVEIKVEPAQRRGFDEMLQKALRGLPAHYGVTQGKLTVGGEAAMFLEGLPERVPTRRVFVIQGNTLYTLTFSPLEQPMPAEVAALWQTVLASFSFEPQP